MSETIEWRGELSRRGKGVLKWVMRWLAFGPRFIPWVVCLAVAAVPVCTCWLS